MARASRIPVGLDTGNIMGLDISELALALLAILVGGFLKGATGAGTPVVGIPILTSLFGIHFAVAVFSVLNLISNLWHAFAYRSHQGERGFVLRFSVMGGIGVVVGSIFLAWLPTEWLMAFLAIIVFAYVGLRLARPGWHLARPVGEKWAVVAGLGGGVMQGAGGISAPISVTYLNAMRLSRDEFIATISVLFSAMSFVQILSLVLLGILTPERFWVGVAAIGPLFAAIWVGEKAAKRLSKVWFDRVILVLLVVIAVRLAWGALGGAN